MGEKELNLEAEILKSVQSAMVESINKSLCGYGSPLAKLIETVVNKHEKNLTRVFDEALEINLATGSQFRQQMQEAFSHKLAKLLVSKLEGETEKRYNEMRSDPRMKARMIIAIEEIMQQPQQKAERAKVEDDER